MLMRICLLSTIGFKPRPAFSRLLAISLAVLGSKGFIRSCVGSGAVMSATLRSSVSAPYASTLTISSIDGWARPVRMPFNSLLA